MIRVLKALFMIIVTGIWLVLAYAVVWRIAEEISFWKAMGSPL